MIQDKVEVRNSIIHGKGVFATENFNVGETIIVNQVIIFNNNLNIPDDILIYCYRWEDNDLCIFIGEGVFINSSKTPNVRVELDYKNNMARFIAIKLIKTDDELFYNYEF